MEESYSEKIEFSAHGIRFAVLDGVGSLTHLDSWTLEMLGGVLPVPGDHFTTLWDPERPEPAECYEVVERHYVGELKGDNCWWVLLKVAEPSPQMRKLFKLAREQSEQSRALSAPLKYKDLQEIRKRLASRPRAAKKCKSTKA